jgi:NDP-sugar pyrophosphorylase family protein
MIRISEVSAAVLAGGLGTRLRAVVADRPKVLAEVAERPFVTYLLDQLASAGLREVLLLTGYRGEQVYDALGEQYRGMRLRYSQEETPLGTGGALRAGLDYLESPTVLLLNGDSFCDLELRHFLTLHAGRVSEASLVLARVADTSRYGRVRLGADDRVVGFEEKSPLGGPGWINAGVYLISRRLIEEIPEGDAPVSLERDVMPGWLAGGKVYGYRQQGPLLDIGTPESYALAEAFLGERWAFAH